MKKFIGNIEELTVSNQNFRKVLHTEQHVQLVVMSLMPKEDIGMEVHKINDQFIRIEKGEGKAIINGKADIINEGSAVIIPAGAEHNIINTSAENSLKLYTIYSPPHHKEDVVHKTKKIALRDESDHL